MTLISPYLQVGPEYTSSPGFIVTGRDSPVRADFVCVNSVECETGSSIYDTQRNKVSIIL